MSNNCLGQYSQYSVLSYNKIIRKLEYIYLESLDCKVFVDGILIASRVKFRNNNFIKDYKGFLNCL